MNIEKLKAVGINYEEGLNRFMNNKDLYEKYLYKLADMTYVEDVNKAICEGDYLKAFEDCHKLKSITGNLSIPDLYGKICIITDALRHNNPDNIDLISSWKEVIDVSQKVVNAINNN